MVDLNLVRVFVTIYNTRSVSTAAEHLNITQPSVSHNLSRLRYLFKDQLFTRTKDGMIPTSYATQLYESLNEHFVEIENIVSEVKYFDPLSSERCFRIALTDIGGLYFLPILLSQLAEFAPNITLEVITVDMTKLSDWLITGKIDAAICNKKLEDKSLNSLNLFEEKYICLVKNDFEDENRQFTLDDFLMGNHAVVAASTGHNLVENYLSKKGLRRKIKLQVPQFSILGELMVQHNLIVTVPSRIGEYFKHNSKIKIFNVPFELPSFEVTLHWYKKSGDQSAQKWFIEFLQSTLGTNHQ